MIYVYACSAIIIISILNESPNNSPSTLHTILSKARSNIKCYVVKCCHCKAAAYSRWGLHVLNRIPGQCCHPLIPHVANSTLPLHLSSRCPLLQALSRNLHLTLHQLHNLIRWVHYRVVFLKQYSALHMVVNLEDTWSMCSWAPDQVLQCTAHSVSLETQYSKWDKLSLWSLDSPAMTSPGPSYVLNTLFHPINSQ